MRVRVTGSFIHVGEMRAEDLQLLRKELQAVLEFEDPVLSTQALPSAGGDGFEVGFVVKATLIADNFTAGISEFVFRLEEALEQVDWLAYIERPTVTGVRADRRPAGASQTALPEPEQVRQPIGAAMKRPADPPQPADVPAALADDIAAAAARIPAVPVTFDAAGDELPSAHADVRIETVIAGLSAHGPLVVAA